jgi:hypothetical protein
MSDRDLDLVLHLDGRTKRLPGIVHRPAYERAVGSGTVGLAFKIDFQRKFCHRLVPHLARIRSMASACQTLGARSAPAEETA